MHLGGLADHPDAALYPEEVADALAHAAQAEIKLRHPERAADLYESALKLRGNHRPTLRALAELALERGEQQKAAVYLRRLAEDAGDRMERAQMFERLGDLRRELNDEPQALSAYNEAVKAYNVPGEEQVVAAREGPQAAAFPRCAARGRGADVRAARRAGEGSQGARRTAPRGRAAHGRARQPPRGGGAAGTVAGRGSAGRVVARRAVRPRRQAAQELRPVRQAGYARWRGCAPPNADAASRKRRAEKLRQRHGELCVGKKIRRPPSARSSRSLPRSPQSCSGSRAR